MYKCVQNCTIVIQCCTTLYKAVYHCIKQKNTVQHCTTLYNVVQCCTIVYNASGIHMVWFGITFVCVGHIAVTGAPCTPDP